MKPLVTFQDLGTIDYKKAWDYQEKLFKENIDKKIAIRNGEKGLKTLNYLLCCEHPHVYTLGKSGDPSHLLMSEERLQEINATYYKINRGGDITYHGPGQLVVYPIFDLDEFFTDIHKYMRFLEEVVIEVLKEYGISSGRVEGLTGVWIDADKENPRKICAMGVKSSRWVTMHGIGFNINTDMTYFNYIVPCGIEDKSVTSLAKELNREVDISEIKRKLTKHFQAIFDFNYA
ncbi:MAG: lipoyl(octanoyl) transferase LipB [Crocinitomicaceae bacterium]|nr:lipoyl(octanoyl) transferase LipB [Crocinitomicaceae bacterium]